MIEAASLPVRDLTHLAIREGQRPRPVYGAHKWFARRLGSAFRSLLVAASIPPNGDFWAAYDAGVDLGGKRVLDPFVGGGTSIIEAQRMGATCFGNDVDAVAVAVTSFQTRMHEMGDLKDLLARLTTEVGEQMAPYHMRADGREVVHHFWVQTVECRACGVGYDAHPHYVLAAEVDKEVKHVFCRHCDAVHVVPKEKAVLRCRECKGTTVVAEGTVVYGTAECPHCGERERLIDTPRRTGRPPDFRLFASESISTVRSGKTVGMPDRLFAKADDHDQAMFTAAAAHLDRLLVDGEPRLPDRLIPTEHRADDRLCQYGYRQYVDLFNPRQKLHLLLLSRALLALDTGLEREGLSIAFSNHLKSVNTMAGYAIGYRRLSPLFALRAFRHIPRPVELNPWVVGTGRGGFPNAVRQVERAAAWSRNPREYKLAGGFTAPRDERKGTADIQVSSASSLGHVADGSVDMVLTDPPYFDNIAYSELADFFLPWQRMLGLVDAPDLAGLAPMQLAAPGRTADDGDEFRDRLAACFKEVSRKLRKNGLAVFTYQHRSAVGWHRLAAALAICPLEIVNVFPMPGDVGSSLHCHEESICWDAVLVARKRGRSRRAPGPADIAWAGELVARWSTELRGLKIAPFRASDRDNLWRAALVASSLRGSSANLDGVPLEAALTLPSEEVDADEREVASKAASMPRVRRMVAVS